MSGAAMQRREHVDAKAVGIVVLLTALWGIQQVAVKVAVAGGLLPVTQAALRSVVATLLVSAWIWAREGRAGLVDVAARRTLAPGMLIALLFGAEFCVLYSGIALTTASRAVVFLYSAPFFTALGAHLFVPGERLRLRQFAGLMLAFAGMAASFADGLVAGGGSVAGDALCLLAGALWGATTVCVKALPVLSRERPAKLLLLQLAGSAPLLVLAAWGMGEFAAPATPTLLAWEALFYQTVVVGFLSFLTWFWLIVTYPAGRIAGFTFLTPLFGILAGAVLLGEHASFALVIGLVCIAVGMRLVNSRHPKGATS
jgi:drug/metabolite transporter (DMT)-like permease